jgi:hypothetical protein
MNSAWGLGLDNLYYVVDWNDYGIDEHKVSSSSTERPRIGSAPTAGGSSEPKRAKTGKA